MFLEEYDRNPTVDQLYLGQVACTVARTKAANPASVKLEHYILKFKDTEPKKSGPLTDEEIKEIADNSKAFWGALTG